jgi:hypothetical protein
VRTFAERQSTSGRPDHCDVAAEIGQSPEESLDGLRPIALVEVKDPLEQEEAGS